MKTDIEKLKELFADFGIEFTLEGATDGGKFIHFETGMDKVDGYIGFMTLFKFNRKGCFTKVEIYE